MTEEPASRRLLLPAHTEVTVARGFRAWLVVFTVVVALALAGLLFRGWRDQRETERQLRELRHAVCGVLQASGEAPTPPPGPEGDRARAIIPKMKALQDASCDHKQ